MKSALGCLLLVAVSLPAFAQKHELGFTLGTLVAQDKQSGVTNIHIGRGNALQFNYGYRFFHAPLIAVYGEVHLMANPQLRITSLNQALTRDAATLFITPGVRVKFFPGSRIAPWVEAGAGYGDYQQSTTLLNGAPNPVPRDVSRAVFTIGGGVDIPVWRFIAIRGEVRDFSAKPPEFNLPVTGRLRNVVAGGGFVLRFGKP